MDWRVHANLTTPEDFWKLWGANQDASVAIAQTEGAARSGGERYVGLSSQLPSKRHSPPGTCFPGHTVAALTLLAWDVLTTLDDEVGVQSSKSDA